MADDADGELAEGVAADGCVVSCWLADEDVVEDAAGFELVVEPELPEGASCGTLFDADCPFVAWFDDELPDVAW